MYSSKCNEVNVTRYYPPLLVSKWRNPTFLQFCSNEGTNLSTSWMEQKLSANLHYAKDINMLKRFRCEIRKTQCYDLVLLVLDRVPDGQTLVHTSIFSVQVVLKKITSIESLYTGWKHFNERGQMRLVRLLHAEKKHTNTQTSTSHIRRTAQLKS